jgi:hypothetical protein
MRSRCCLAAADATIQRRCPSCWAPRPARGGGEHHTACGGLGGGACAARQAAEQGRWRRGRLGRGGCLGLTRHTCLIRALQAAEQLDFRAQKIEQQGKEILKLERALEIRDGQMSMFTATARKQIKLLEEQLREVQTMPV